MLYYDTVFDRNYRFSATTKIEVDLQGMLVVSESKKCLMIKFLNFPLGKTSIGAVI